MGTPTASVSQEVADVQRLMQQSGLSYSMHSAGTTVGWFNPLKTDLQLNDNAKARDFTIFRSRDDELCIDG